MKIFWKINFFTSIIIFMLFMLYLLAVSSSILGPTLRNAVISSTALFFIYGAFWEIIQIPICLIALLFRSKPQRPVLFFLTLIALFMVKVGLYIYVLGSGL